MAHKIDNCPYCAAEADKFVFSVEEKMLMGTGRQVRCYACGACGPLKRTDKQAIEAWNRIATVSKASIDFDKIATSFHPGQVAGYMQELNYTRKCTLLYLWLYNNVSVNWLTDVKRDNGRGMYRKFAEAISNRLLEGKE